jgi:hypothetical protein
MVSIIACLEEIRLIETRTHEFLAFLLGRSGSVGCLSLRRRGALPGGIVEVVENVRRVDGAFCADSGIFHGLAESLLTRRALPLSVSRYC